MISLRGRFFSGLAAICLLALSGFAAAGPTVSLAVDASQAPRKIFHARLRIPANPGTLTLYYPKWIPGEHAPDGPVDDLAGIKFSAGGQTLKWRRDLLDGWTINVAADRAAALGPPPEVLDHYKNLVAQAGALFGTQHYRRYHFLYTLSDHVAHFGLEHHESDDSRVSERGLGDETERKLHASLLPHEYTHSWNGKYRRPADLTTPDYQQPMQTDLLWVY